MDSKLRIVGVWVLTSAAAMGGRAIAQETKPLLEGPKVEEVRVPGTSDTLATGRAKPGAMRPLPTRLFLRALQTLREDSTPEALRLTPEQSEQILAVTDEVRREGAARRQRGEPEMQDRPREKPDPAADEMQAMTTEERRDAMSDRMEQIRERMPDSSVAQTRVWAILTPDQRAYVEVEMEKIRKELEGRRNQEAMEKMVKEGPATDAAPQGDRRSRMREYLAKLSPEKRDEVVRRLQERRGRGRTEPVPPEKPAAPTVEKVKVPEPKRPPD